MNNPSTDCKPGNDLKPIEGIGILSELSATMSNARHPDEADN
jgi:hypothetical protein